MNNTIGKSIRVFALGIGGGVSSALIEGVARAGNGFAQMVRDGEKMDKKVVRMLKGALSPHVSDYSLEVKYEASRNEDDDVNWELVEKVTDSFKVMTTQAMPQKSQTPISLFDQTLKSDEQETTTADDQDPWEHLPAIPVPKLLQTPRKVPPLFPFTRTTIYILMSPETAQKSPKSIILRGTSPQGPLELEVNIQRLPLAGKKIHQLAAKKAMKELEQGRGWLSGARTEDGTLLKDQYQSSFNEMVQREGVRLGMQFQISGKFCSLVAVSENEEPMERASEFREDVGHLNAASTSVAAPRPAGSGKIVRRAAYHPPPIRRGGGKAMSCSFGRELSIEAEVDEGVEEAEVEEVVEAEESSGDEGFGFFDESSPVAPDESPRKGASDAFAELAVENRSVLTPPTMTDSDKVHAMIDMQSFEGT